MKFGDKLIELRKKNGYSQEELAEKLGVSRQSVSKWESNNTYPETDKIIQIANLFDCSMDDLINDKITNVETTYRKNKNNFNNIIDSFLDFITKSISMFSKMKFTSGLRCVIEMIILAFILALFGHTICGISSSIISNLFKFINYDVVNNIKSITYSIFMLVWFIIAVIIMVHTFKIRYLDYYVEEEKVKEIKDNNNEDKNKKGKTTSKIVEEKIIIRDENDKPFAFLGVLSKIVMFFIKFMAFWILLGFIFTDIGLVVASCLSFYYIFTNIIFLWIFLVLVSSTVISIQITVLLIKFIFNLKANYKIHLVVFISSLIIFGLGIALTALTFKNIEFVDDNSIFNLETKEINILYKDNLVIDSMGVGLNNNYKYIIDNDIEENNIIVSKEVDSRYFKLDSHETSIDNIPVVKVTEFEDGSFKAFYNLFIDNLKKNKIYTFDNYGNDPLVIKANENTINKLIENQKKLYLVEENRNENEIDIRVHDDKVHFPNGIEGSYNALDDSFIYEDENYSCVKSIEVTKYGEKYIYVCNDNDLED